MAEAEYISKEAALACFSDWIDRYGHEHTAEEMVEYQRIEDLPAADVRPVVKARWYWDNYKYDWCCSNCFHHADHRIDKDDVFKEPSFSFCPNCGADMREAVK